MSKQVIVTRYQPDGAFEIRATLTLKRPVSGADFDEAKGWVERCLEPMYRNSSGYTVEWRREGEIEGYMVPHRSSP